MNRRLKKYLKEQGATPVDCKVLDEYREEMDRVMPKISENIRRRELGAAELRVGANRTSRSRKTEEKS